jgi:hypothetical protein
LAGVWLAVFTLVVFAFFLAFFFLLFFFFSFFFFASSLSLSLAPAAVWGASLSFSEGCARRKRRFLGVVGLVFLCFFNFSRFL